MCCFWTGILVACSRFVPRLCNKMYGKCNQSYCLLFVVIESVKAAITGIKAKGVAKMQFSRVDGNRPRT